MTVNEDGALQSQIDAIVAQIDEQIFALVRARSELDGKLKELRELRRRLAGPQPAVPAVAKSWTRNKYAPKYLTKQQWQVVDVIEGWPEKTFSVPEVLAHLEHVSDPTIYKTFERLRAFGYLGKAHRDIAGTARTPRQYWRILDRHQIDHLREVRDATA